MHVKFEVGTTNPPNIIGIELPEIAIKTTDTSGFEIVGSEEDVKTAFGLLVGLFSRYQSEEAQDENTPPQAENMSDDPQWYAVVLANAQITLAAETAYDVA